MKALVVITGRGLGGDAVIGMNIIKSLESKGFDCELALDSSAPGILFEKNGYSWYKISIPQAGGHAANKITTIKAGLKTIGAVFKCRNLIKKVKADIVVGVIGGGAVVGCLGAKLAKVPAVGVLSTPLDTKVCTKLNTCIVFPEAHMFRQSVIPENVYRSYFPVAPNILKGNKEIGLEKIKEHCRKEKEKNPNAIDFDENKKTILFSSGSTIFEKMAKAVSDYSKLTDKYNIILVGLPLKEEYYDWFDDESMIYLSYIDWIKDLYEIIDLAVLTDDGMMLQEAMVCNLPSIALLRVKYGRYHDMADVFEGAVFEANNDNLSNVIENVMNNLSEVKLKTKDYGEKIINSSENIANIILNEYKKSN
ncbi:MurG-like protein [Methanobrevibacter sp. 87.7]|uniref:glycosyltransferase n=1 Tax=Methanobrevibacter sp. 87.7 TaxID=387957 RepID=UPI000B512F76|nr:MurG-like protein [Methanobrevibacter sp. 87.7]